MISMIFTHEAEWTRIDAGNLRGLHVQGTRLII